LAGETAGESVTILAQKLLSVFGNIKNMSRSISRATHENKRNRAGKGSSAGAAFEIGKRMEVSGEAVNPQVTKPEIIITQIKPLLKGKKKEYFILVSLDTRNRIITRKTISIGSLNSSIVHPREVFKEALAASAASVIFVHNHPSGDPTPSDDDIAITKRLAEAGKLLGIDVLDHIVICDNDHVSMKARNLY
jgi:DNA repair protein RadC